MFLNPSLSLHNIFGGIKQYCQTFLDFIGNSLPHPMLIIGVVTESRYEFGSHSLTEGPVGQN